MIVVDPLFRAYLRHDSGIISVMVNTDKRSSTDQAERLMWECTVYACAKSARAPHEEGMEGVENMRALLMKTGPMSDEQLESFAQFVHSSPPKGLSQQYAEGWMFMLRLTQRVWSIHHGAESTQVYTDLYESTLRLYGNQLENSGSVAQ